MRIKTIQIEIRRPTVQYGYNTYRYEVEIDEIEESIENVLRYIHREHELAIAQVNEDARDRSSNSESSEIIPF